MARVEIDLNIRVRGNWTLADISDADEPVVAGQAVEVFEPESGVVGTGRIEEVDLKRRLLFLSVDWANLRESAITPEEMQDFVAGVAAAALQLTFPTPDVHQFALATPSNVEELLAPSAGRSYGAQSSRQYTSGSVLSRP